MIEITFSAFWPKRTVIQVGGIIPKHCADLKIVSIKLFSPLTTKERSVSDLDDAAYYKREFENAIERLNYRDEELTAAREEIERLKQHRAHTICQECGNRGVFNNGIELMDKLALAVKALEIYAMTNETFPEYGNVARSTLDQLKNRQGEER